MADNSLSKSPLRISSLKPLFFNAYSYIQTCEFINYIPSDFFHDRATWEPWSQAYYHVTFLKILLSITNMPIKMTARFLSTYSWRIYWIGYDPNTPFLYFFFGQRHFPRRLERRSKTAYSQERIIASTFPSFSWWAKLWSWSPILWVSSLSIQRRSCQSPSSSMVNPKSLLSTFHKFW